MEPLRIYDYLVLTRRRLFDWIRPLAPETYSRSLPNWGRTLDRLLTHVVASEWYYVQRLRDRDVPPYEQWVIREETPLPFAALEVAWTEQSADTRAALRAVHDWSAQREYRVTDDDGRLKMVTASAGDIVTQLVLHEVHHRAQAMNMLQQLGVVLEDLDFNAWMYQRRDAEPEC
jgi:uncharacterized damage-inducible protein DinB